VNLFPMFLKLSGRECLVVGAGRIGEPKIESLLQAEARVRVVAPRASRKVTVQALGGWILWEPRKFIPTDLDRVFLVVAATNSHRVNQQIFREAQRRNVLCNVVDDPPHCDFYYPAIVRRGQLQIAISTGGQSPSLAQRLRQELEQQFGPEYETWVEQLGEARRQLLAHSLPPRRRKALLHQLASRESLEAKNRSLSSERRTLP
jgi:precorrin-2 dehydrogenase